MVPKESTVLNDTISTDSSVSPPNFEENMVVIAATGALTEIIIETSRVPLTPIRYSKPSAAKGYTIRLKKTEKIQRISRNAFNTLLCAK